MKKLVPFAFFQLLFYCTITVASQFLALVALFNKTFMIFTFIDMNSVASESIEREFDSCVLQLEATARLDLQNADRTYRPPSVNAGTGIN